MATMPNGAMSRLSVCVDDYEDREISGRLYHQYSAETETFKGVNTLFQKIENLLDSISYPQASTQPRSFKRRQTMAPRTKKEAEAPLEHDITSHRGERNTFIVQVKYRQNSTWQGTITWTERNVVRNFRSALELLKLIDSSFYDEDEDAMDEDEE